MWKLIEDKEQSTESKGATLLYFDEVLGLGLKDIIGKSLEVPADVQKLIEARDKARAEKDFETSDKLRAEIEEKGFDVMDSEEGTKVKAIRNL